jgi:cytochrome c peroxidase
MAQTGKLIAFSALFWTCVLVLLPRNSGGPIAPVVYAAAAEEGRLDSNLAAVLSAAGFTGKIEQTFRRKLEASLGRPISPKLANLGRLLWFDKLHSLHHDNTCGGCHSPTNGFGDSQPMAITWWARTAPDPETSDVRRWL